MPPVVAAKPVVQVAQHDVPVAISYRRPRVMRTHCPNRAGHVCQAGSAARRAHRAVAVRRHSASIAIAPEPVDGRGRRGSRSNDPSPGRGLGGLRIARTGCRQRWTVSNASNTSGPAAAPGHPSNSPPMQARISQPSRRASQFIPRLNRASGRSGSSGLMKLRRSSYLCAAKWASTTRGSNHHAQPAPSVLRNQ
jgi:hypothetical protein